MFFVGQNETISITANLNMLTFKKSDDSAYYGYDLGDGNNYQSIPSNWDFEIINLPTPEGSNLSADKKSFTYSGDTNNTYSVRIRIFDKSTNTTINNLSNDQLSFYIRDNFTVAKAFWNSCDEKYVLAKTPYGIDFNSIINKDNFFGCQFHPEKSLKSGLKFIKNFIDL